MAYQEERREKGREERNNIWKDDGQEFFKVDERYREGLPEQMG